MNPFGVEHGPWGPSGRGPVLDIDTPTTQDAGGATRFHPEVPPGGDDAPSYETRRSSLTPVVRSYADRLYAAIKKIYKKYGVSNVAELHAKVASGQKPKNLKPGELKSDSAELSKLVADLEFALVKNALPEGASEAEKGWVMLHDVPSFSKIPPAAALKDKTNGCNFAWIWEDQYREGRDIGDFSLTEKDLRDVGFDDPRKIRELLEAVAEARENKEPERPAKVFDINETIAKKKTEDPDHPDSLTTKEVLEAMGQAGCRPATLGELLAFGKEFWKPDTDPKTLTDEEQTFQHADATYVYALGSPFSDFDISRRRVPFLNWHSGERRLNGYDLVGHDWSGDNRFLVVPVTAVRRKSSS